MLPVLNALSILPRDNKMVLCFEASIYQVCGVGYPVGLPPIIPHRYDRMNLFRGILVAGLTVSQLSASSRSIAVTGCVQHHKILTAALNTTISK